VKISIITATFNSQSFIECSVLSVLNQTYSNIELIIVDGLSTDNTLDIIRKINDPRIHLISEKDNGIYYALNKGISLASGDIIGFLHSDDFFVDNQIVERIVNEFRNTKLDGVYSNLKYVSINDSNKIVRNWRSMPFKRINLKFGWMPPHPTLFLLKSVYNEIGDFNVKYRISADYDFILRLFISQNYSIKYLDTYISNMRTGGASNKSLKAISKKSREDLDIISNYPLWGTFTFVFKNLRKISQFFN
jgi:glycosyltransferase involved in cell wall biosynthesis